jgi:hypothetical protein
MREPTLSGVYHDLGLDARHRGTHFLIRRRHDSGCAFEVGDVACGYSSDEMPYKWKQDHWARLLTDEEEVVFQLMEKRRGRP